MDPGFLLNGVLRSVMGGRGKPSRKALRYLTGGHRSVFSNPATLLTAAGVAWGIVETLQGRGSTGSTGSTGSMGSIGSTGSMGSVPVSVPAPLTGGSGAPPSPQDDAMRLIRLAVSAAHADGTMNERERAAVLEQASAAGVAEVLEQELQRRTPLADIVSGVGEPAERATLYVLAFTILRADAQVTGAERIYLARLAQLLGLDVATVQQLERDAGERIEALGDQGQLGG